MSNQNRSGSVDRQYLKAMGIDLWVDRNSALNELSQVSAAVEVASDASHESALRDPGVHKSLTETSAKEFAASIDDLKLTCSEPLRTAELLVLTEGSSLSEQCSKLLGSMFKAIELDNSQWLQADLHSDNGKAANAAGTAAPLVEIVKSVKPKALVVLVKTGGNTTALDALRGFQHRSRALKSFVIVSFHPQDLLDNPDAKRPAWEDLKQLRQWLA